MTKDEYMKSSRKLMKELEKKLGPDAFTVWNKVIYLTLTLIIHDAKDYYKDLPDEDQTEMGKTLSEKYVRSMPLYVDTFIRNRTTLLEGEHPFRKEREILSVVEETIDKLSKNISQVIHETGEFPGVPYINLLDDVDMVGKLLSEDPLKINIL